MTGDSDDEGFLARTILALHLGRGGPGLEDALDELHAGRGEEARLRLQLPSRPLWAGAAALSVQQVARIHLVTRWYPILL